MKKLLLLFAIAVCFFACKDTQPPASACKDCDTDTLTVAELSKFPEYKNEEVQKMVDYYWTLPKTNKNIIGVLQFSNPPARKLLKNREDLIVVVGAYLSDTLGMKKGDRAIIIGLTDKTKTIYFDFKSLEAVSASASGGGSQVCPPPYDAPCRISFK